jgi:hypothetical protein
METAGIAALSATPVTVRSALNCTRVLLTLYVFQSFAYCISRWIFYLNKFIIEQVHNTVKAVRQIE